MVNKRLIEDLTRLERANIDWREYGSEAHGKWVGDIASRALEEIEYLQNEVEYYKSECSYSNFDPGDFNSQ